MKVAGPGTSFHLTRQEAFEAIASFESGRTNISISEDVMALASGSSLYIASPLLCDPYKIPHEFEIKHIIGNIGRPRDSTGSDRTPGHGHSLHEDFQEQGSEGWPSSTCLVTMFHLVSTRRYNTYFPFPFFRQCTTSCAMVVHDLIIYSPKDSSDKWQSMTTRAYTVRGTVKIYRVIV